jgi:hypothetical protein
VLFDQPAVIDGAEAQLKRLGVADRCDLVAGDFFEAVPAGADGYLLSNIVHDWDDDRALVLLRRCAQAMRPDSTLLISEWTLPDTPDVPAPIAKLVDLQMMIISDGGRERSPGEFGVLLERAGLRLTQVIRRQPIEPTLLEVARE